MVEQAVRHHTTFRGVRRFDPSRDIGPVTRLIREAFADELGPGDQAILRELSMLRFLSPLLWFIDRITPEFQDVLGGFVWVEDRRVVGNVTLTRMGPTGEHWLISNVVVAPAYRRRGIARELMLTAIQTAQRRGGRVITLQVRSDNEPAQALYRSLGFKRLESNTEMRLPYLRRSPSALSLNAQLVPWTPADDDKAFALAQAVVPPTAQAFLPLQRKDFRARRGGFFQSIVEALRGRARRCWAIAQGDAFIATLVIDAALYAGTHRLKLMVHPEHRGQLEPGLVSHGLTWLARFGPAPVEAEVPTDHVAAREALQAHGFAVVRVLDRLGLELHAGRRIPVREGP